MKELIKTIIGQCNMSINQPIKILFEIENKEKNGNENLHLFL